MLDYGKGKGEPFTFTYLIIRLVGRLSEAA